jgi:DNA-binding GntR family transcriptional regulator
MNQIFNKAVSKTLRTEVVEMLRDAIVTGKVDPGDHLKESDIASQMMVSRSPVREAFRQLEQEGLIISVPNQGCYVKAFDNREIEEIFTLRAFLENFAFELIIRENKLTPSDWDQLDWYIEQQREAIREGAFHRLTELDMDFHEFLCRKSGYNRLVKMWQSLRGQIQVLFYQRFKALEQVPETVDTDHHTIIELLRQGNIEQLKTVNQEINLRVARECIEVFQSISDE